MFVVATGVALHRYAASVQHSSQRTRSATCCSSCHSLCFSPSPTAIVGPVLGSSCRWLARPLDMLRWYAPGHRLVQVSVRPAPVRFPWPQPRAPVPRQADVDPTPAGDPRTPAGVVMRIDIAPSGTSKPSRGRPPPDGWGMFGWAPVPTSRDARGAGPVLGPLRVARRATSAPSGSSWRRLGVRSSSIRGRGPLPLIAPRSAARPRGVVSWYLRAVEQSDGSWLPRFGLRDLPPHPDEPSVRTFLAAAATAIRGRDMCRFHLHPQRDSNPCYRRERATEGPPDIDGNL